MNIGSRIKQARLANGMSQTRLADLLGITRSACSQWESPRGGTVPQSSRLVELAELLGVSFTWLVSGDTEPAASGGARRPTVPAEHGVGTARPARLLNKEERELIGLYHQMSSQGRSALLHLLRSILAARQDTDN